MSDKMIRKLKVYGYAGRNYKDVPTIMLKGQWLERLGYDCGDYIEVICYDGEIKIRRIGEEAAR